MLSSGSQSLPITPWSCLQRKQLLGLPPLDKVLYSKHYVTCSDSAALIGYESLFFFKCKYFANHFRRSTHSIYWIALIFEKYEKLNWVHYLLHLLLYVSKITGNDDNKLSPVVWFRKIVRHHWKAIHLPF